MPPMIKTKHAGIYYRLLRDGTRVYYLRVTRQYRRTWLRAGQNLELAKERMASYRLQRAAVPASVSSSKTKWRDLSADYLEHYKGKTIGRERNWARMESIARMLGTYFDPFEIKRIGPWEIEQYIRKRQHKGLGPGTINREVDFLRAALNRAVAWQKLERAPKIERLKSQEQRARILNDEELEKILPQVSDMHRDAILIALDTGMRLGEIVRIRRKDLDSDSRSVHIPDTKNLKPRTVPLTDRALKIIERRLLKNKGSMFALSDENRVSQFFTAERKKIKDVSPWRFHDLRHTAATRLLQAGNDPATVMAITGHSDLEILMRYLHTDEQRKREAIDKLQRSTRKKGKASA